MKSYIFLLWCLILSSSFAKKTEKLGSSYVLKGEFSTFVNEDLDIYLKFIKKEDRPPIPFTGRETGDGAEAYGRETGDGQKMLGRETGDGQKVLGRETGDGAPIEFAFVRNSDEKVVYFANYQKNYLLEKRHTIANLSEYSIFRFQRSKFDDLLEILIFKDDSLNGTLIMVRPKHSYNTPIVDIPNGGEIQTLPESPDTKYSYILRGYMDRVKIHELSTTVSGKNVPYVVAFYIDDDMVRKGETFRLILSKFPYTGASVKDLEIKL